MQTLEALTQISKSPGNRQTGTDSEKTPTCHKRGKRAHAGAANAPQLGYRGTNQTGSKHAGGSGGRRVFSDLLSDLRLVDTCTVLRTLRFDDHRGMKPSDVSFNGRSMTSRVSRSKTIGSDPNVSSRMVFVHSCCYTFEGRLASWRLGSPPNCRRLRTRLSVTFSNHERQWPSPVKVEIRLDIRLAEQSAAFSTGRHNPIFRDLRRLRIRLALSCPVPRCLSWGAQRSNTTTSVDGARMEVTSM